MISRMKAAVKASMMQSKIEEYYYYMDEQFVSYHDWIVEREAAYRSSMQTTEKELTAKVIGLGEKVVVNGTDILVFATDRQWLDEHAVSVLVNYFKEYSECQIVYGDEDEWNSNRTIRMNPWFKPDFSPELLGQYFYFGNVVAVRAEYYKEIVQSDTVFQTAGIAASESVFTLENLYELCLNAAFPVSCTVIGHVPYVLYHAPNIQHLCTGMEYDKLRGVYVEKSLVKAMENKKISIVIPSKDHPDILKTCLSSIQKTCQGCDYEIIIVDNGSSEENQVELAKMMLKYRFNYVLEPMEFNFSKMCNLGAAKATGDILLFLNDDIEAMENGWLEHLKGYALRQHVGAVGAKLYYPDSKMIQHAGITNLRLGPVHKLQFLQDERPYYDGRNRNDHNVIAVTGACLMVRKDIFEECGGFSESLAVAFNDVELCFRIYKKGYCNVVCNSVALYHHESLSRGNDETQVKQARLLKERDKMYGMHPELYGKDPFYHPYLNTVILDTNYSFAYQYPAGSDVAVEEPFVMKETVKEEWYNECLQVSLEYAGDLTAWLEGPGKTGEYLYFQGYQFVIGSDNPEYTRFLLCEEEDTKQIWKIPCIPTFRPDLDKNVAEGYASLCGFSLVIERNSLPKGRYRVGGMAKSRISRQVLCKFTNKYVEI